MQNNEKQSARVLLHIYRIMAKPVSYSILKTLMHGEYHTKALSKQLSSNTNNIYSFVPQSTFFNSLDELVQSQLIDRIVHNDRTVSYRISDLGRFILEDSEDILDKVKQVFGVAPKTKETKYGGKNK